MASNEPERKYIGLPALFLLFLFAFSFACSKGEEDMIRADSISLPEIIGSWKLEGPPQTITRETIFDYMDGGGELYLAYKFERLLVYKYLDGAENEILVEIYEMKHPDEAFGLLSLDWSGEPANLSPGTGPLPENPVCPAYTALYGEGLLRARVDNLYLRVLALRETPGVKEIILKLGKTIAGHASQATFPALLDVIRPKADSIWQIKKDRTSYFHSHLILNSLYYLSHENILHLDPTREAIYTEWTQRDLANKKSARMIIIKYPEVQKAGAALADFLGAYLQEKAERLAEISLSEKEKAIQVEDGWLGWKLAGNYLVLVFEAPEEAAVKKLFVQLELR
ncbi:MAG: hypothetical protein OP8BY_0397 [Candidatus Saccharicenans subterraneus]|uniref:Uncharacterized protein n=1 Tax=Candidatus Saccharicenans subterraneus TaxID=2508984 RepID=A0A3E2BKM2_9BACT|nr:MAG: hypothetical protein OP8BY_0397 [Candidatus Saccharicenans subterraneum]